MNLHLFSTDISCTRLVDQLPPEDQVTAIIVPSNRQSSEKFGLLVQAAERRGIPTIMHARGQDLQEELPQADAGISWLYSQIITVHDIDRYSNGLLNMHGGVIPDYRGASVLHWAIINGDDELGITWHEIVEEVDAGPIWTESRIPIRREATAMDVRRDMIDAGIALFSEAWSAFKTRDGAPRYPDLETGRVWPQRKPSDGELGPNWTERQVRDLVRALCPPWPPAFLVSSGVRQPIARVTSEPNEASVEYRTVDGATLYLQLAEA